MNKRIWMMIIAFIFLAVISVGCAKTKTVEETTPAAETPAAESSPPAEQKTTEDPAAAEPSSVPQLTADDVFELYDKAKEAYEWFDLTTIPHDSKNYIEVDGVTYYEVVQPGINSKKALADYLNGFFTDNITEELMNTSSDRYVEQEGKLYVLPADRGTDILKGEETLEFLRESDTKIKFTVTVETYDDPDQQNVVGHEKHDFFLEYTDNGWRFTNFGLVR